MNAFLQKCAAKHGNSFENAPVTVGFLGDSVTHGCFELVRTGEESFDTVYKPDEAYGVKLVRILHTLFPAAQINLINAGISGGSAPNGLQRMERDLLPYHPDLVVVCFGLNDSCGGIDRENVYLDALRGIFERLAAEGIPCIFMTPNTMCDHVAYVPDPLFRRTEAIIAHAQTSGDLDDYMKNAKALAASMGVPVCDVYAKWQRMRACGVDTTALLANKCNHPVPDLHWLFAMSLAETIFGME